MIAALLASWLVTQQWEWDKADASHNVTAYRVYWGASGTAWCSANKVDFPAATSCGAVGGCSDEGKCCGEIPMPTFSPAFMVVTAVNSYGESLTEHGDIVNCP